MGSQLSVKYADKDSRDQVVSFQYLCYCKKREETHTASSVQEENERACAKIASLTPANPLRKFYNANIKVWR